MSRHSTRDRTGDLLEHAAQAEKSPAPTPVSEPSGTVGSKDCSTCHGRGFELLEEKVEGRRTIGSWFPSGWMVECVCVSRGGKTAGGESGR